MGEDQGRCDVDLEGRLHLLGLDHGEAGQAGGVAGVVEEAAEAGSFSQDRLKGRKLHHEMSCNSKYLTRRVRIMMTFKVQESQTTRKH